MVDYVPIEKAMPIRQPSTANLMIDSEDGTTDANGLFTGNDTYNGARVRINRNSSILNGFFTRIGTTEIVLNWYLPNLSAGVGNLDFTVLQSPSTEITITLEEGNYTVKEALDEIVLLLNANGGLAGTFSIVNENGQVKLHNSSTAFDIADEVLAVQLGFEILAAMSTDAVVGYGTPPDLRIFKYLDFVSPELTYCQDLKDSSTTIPVKDVLARWYMSYDTFTQEDSYGFPILMGYKPFNMRRAFNPPKQIRWEPNLPIGQLSFEVYGKVATELTPGQIQYTFKSPYVLATRPGGGNLTWLMTLQVSEQ
jgi:hypothetical protein